MGFLIVFCKCTVEAADIGISQFGGNSGYRCISVAQERNEEHTHQHIKHLIAVDMLLTELLGNFPDDFNDFGITEGIKVKISSAFFSGKGLTEELGQKPAFGQLIPENPLKGTGTN